MSNHSEKPALARDDWTIDQGWLDYTADEHAVWDLLYKRQKALDIGNMFS